MSDDDGERVPSVIIQNVEIHMSGFLEYLIHLQEFSS